MSYHTGMTQRLYYHDAYLCRFEAAVVAVDGQRVYLDRTAFYPASGGQPHDTGKLGGVRVVDVIDEEDRIAHLIEGAAPSGVVACEVDWARRLDHSQQHTGQHLLSAVFSEMFGLHTVAVHFGGDTATIELASASVTAEQMERAAERANEIVFENRAVTVRFAPASEDLGLRREVDRQGELRLVEIAGLDRSACGGTHVRSTAEIGPIAIRRQEKIRGNVRLEFVCGMRAIRRARADFEALSGVARALGSGLDEAPALVRANLDRVQELEKGRKKIALELEQMRGRELHQATPPDAAGLRRVVLREPITDDLRARAQSFTGQGRAVLVAICDDPPSLLVAASKDSGVNAGEMVKDAVTANGGRGGGSAQLGQGSVPDAEALQRVVSIIRAR